jgi:hypothetical protein
LFVETLFFTLTGTYCILLWLGVDFTSNRRTLAGLDSSLHREIRLASSLLLAASMLTVSLNVLLSILLAGRLLWLGHKYRQAFGKSSNIDTYASPTAIIVESAALYTVPLFVANVLLFVSKTSENHVIPAGLSTVNVVSLNGFMMSDATFCIPTRPLHQS